MSMANGKRDRSFVSAQQVADLAGVSRSAVSRTFTAGASVSEGTRNKVLKAAHALGYHVNHLARSLIHETSGMVCIIGADMDTPYQARILDAITRRLQTINRIALVINTAGSSENVEAALRQTLNYRADATIVLSGKPPASLIDTCVKSGQQVILINRDDHLAGPINIALDNASAAREAFRMLDRAGCRKVVVVSSQAGTPSLVAREDAFLDAAREAGADASVIRAGPTSHATGYKSALRLLPLSNRPHAAFCVTDLLACGFMDAARFEFGLAIPKDICVVGFDDIEQSGWASYELTTFRQPLDEIAEHICALLDQTDPAGRGAATAVFHASPVWRRSVRPN